MSNSERKYVECDDCHLVKVLPVGYRFSPQLYLEARTDWLVIESEDELTFYCENCKANNTQH